MAIRKFRPSDEGQCIWIRRECWAKLLSKCYPSEISKGWTHKYRKGDLIKYSKKHDVWVVADNGPVLAFMSFEIVKNKAQIGLNFVRCSNHRRGIGRRLYWFAEGKTLEKYPRLRTIIADAVWYDPAIKFYESMGFRKVKTIIHNKNPRDKTLRMEKRV